MTIIVYADFSCPLSYLASQRVDRLPPPLAGRIDWRAVDVPGERNGHLALRRPPRDELAELAYPGESVPAAITTRAAHPAVAAYAEAVSDGIHLEMRRRLFDAIWTDQLDLGDTSEVRRIIAAMTWPQPDLTVQLGVPDIPLPSTRVTDPHRAIRQFGATIAPDFLPVTTALTTSAHRRIETWRRAWLGLPDRDLPAVLADGFLLTGTAALGRLAELAYGATPATHTRAEPVLV